MPTRVTNKMIAERMIGRVKNGHNLYAHRNGICAGNFCWFDAEFAYDELREEADNPLKAHKARSPVNTLSAKRVEKVFAELYAILEK